MFFQFAAVNLYKIKIFDLNFYFVDILKEFAESQTAKWNFCLFFIYIKRMVNKNFGFIKVVYKFSKNICFSCLGFMLINH